MFGITKKDIIPNAISAVLGGIVAIATGLALGYFQNRDPILEYIRNDTPPLKDKDTNTAIYLTSVYNVGNEEAENVDIVMAIPKASIVSHGITPAAIQHSYLENSGISKIHVDMLNPGEAMTVQLLVKSDVDLPPKPEVTVRGKGVTGVERGTPTAIVGSTPWGPLTSVSTILFAFVVPSLGILFGFAIYNYVDELIRKHEKQRKVIRSLYKVRIEFDGAERVKVTTIEGVGKSADPVVLLPWKTHLATGYSFEDFRKLGEGEHVISA